MTLGIGVLAPVASAAPAGKTRPSTTFALPPGSLPDQLAPRAQARLPRIETRAERIIGAAMDQPALTEVQVVSALHIRRAFRKPLGGAAWRSAVRIAWRESRLLPNAVNDSNSDGTNDWGLFQLNDGGTLQYAGGVPGADALRPAWNARAAARLVADVGWDPWGGMLRG